MRAAECPPDGAALRPQVALMPYNPCEACTLASAGKRAGKVANTIKNWCEKDGIGRRVGGRWAVSKVALEMFLEGNSWALNLYLSGNREHPDVVAYFDRLGIPLKK
jgi:hypothetical protein